jgi:hypothetical protein
MREFTDRCASIEEKFTAAAMKRRWSSKYMMMASGPCFDHSKKTVQNFLPCGQSFAHPENGDGFEIMRPLS